MTFYRYIYVKKRKQTLHSSTGWPCVYYKKIYCTLQMLYDILFIFHFRQDINLVCTQIIQGCVSISFFFLRNFFFLYSLVFFLFDERGRGGYIMVNFAVHIRGEMAIVPNSKSSNTSPKMLFLFYWRVMCTYVSTILILRFM